MSNMGTPFYLEYMNKGTPVNRAFNTLIGLNSVRQMNTPEAWVSGVPAFGGVASARGMAQFYQACLGLDDLRVFPSDVRGWMRNVVIDGPDLTLKTPTAFSCGFMHDPADPATGRKLRHLFGSGGFGHAGAGGSHAFADPAHGLSFGYAMNRMDLSVLPGVTGYWQIAGRSNIREFEKLVELDMKYIDNWSLWLDIKLLLKTVPAVLFARGAK